MDPLGNAHRLPEDIRRIADQLVVGRCGDDPQSFMRTEGIARYVAPNSPYPIAADHLAPFEGKPLSSPLRGPLGRRPTYGPEGLEPGRERRRRQCQYFRYLGTLTLAALGFYGARPVNTGYPVVFDTDRNLPITITGFGARYAVGFLQIAGKGGGAFVEYHDLTTSICRSRTRPAGTSCWPALTAMITGSRRFASPTDR